MSNVPDEYEMETRTLDAIESPEERIALTQSVDNNMVDDTNCNEEYYVITEEDQDEVNLIRNADNPETTATNLVDLTENWIDVCRLCANTTDHLIPIFEGEGMDHELSSKIHSHLPIQVSEQDSLPLHLCYHCAATLLAWHELAEGCLDAEQRLLQMQNDLQKKQTTSNPDETLNETNTGLKTEESHIQTRNEMLHTSAIEKVDCNEESGSNNIERSSRMRMPFKTFLERQSIFWRLYKKPVERSIGKGDLEDNSETIWNANMDVGTDQSSVTSDPLQCSDITEKGQFGAYDNEKSKSQGKTRLEEKLVIKQELEEMETPVKFKLVTVKEEIQDEEQGLIACQICLQEFLDENELEEHANTHRVFPHGHESYRCIHCGKCFKLKDSYLRHMRIHSNERPFTCHICAKQFRDSGGLSRHLKDVHAKVKNFSCDMCGKRFASKATREDHRRTHTGERPYVCESCGNTFKSKASLYIHSKLHTDEFPHPCSYCHKKFRRRQEMLAHITTHTGEKNYGCEVCSKRFRVKSELVRHKLVHSDNKPFVCSKCGLAFRQKRYLNNHIKNRHIETL